VKDIPRKPGFYRDAKLRESFDNCGLKPNHYQHLKYSVENDHSGEKHMQNRLKHLVFPLWAALALPFQSFFGSLSENIF
jgi:hypothetical protein